MPIFGEKKERQKKDKRRKEGNREINGGGNGNQGSMLAGKKETESVPGHIYP